MHWMYRHSCLCQGISGPLESMGGGDQYLSNSRLLTIKYTQMQKKLTIKCTYDSKVGKIWLFSLFAFLADGYIHQQSDRTKTLRFWILFQFWHKTSHFWVLFQFRHKISQLWILFQFWHRKYHRGSLCRWLGLQAIGQVLETANNLYDSQVSCFTHFSRRGNMSKSLFPFPITLSFPGGTRSILTLEPKKPKQLNI